MLLSHINVSLSLKSIKAYPLVKIFFKRRNSLHEVFLFLSKHLFLILQNGREGPIQSLSTHPSKINPFFSMIQFSLFHSSVIAIIAL